jgi:hypothetical protein
VTALELSNEYAATRPVVAAVAPLTPADAKTTIVALPQRIVRRRDAIVLPPSIVFHWA